jgi:hypothetical protein
MSLFENLPSWKEKAYLYMATDSTMKGLIYIIPEEVIGFEVPTLRSADTILYRVRTNLNRAKGFLEEVTGKKPLAEVKSVEELLKS